MGRRISKIAVVSVAIVILAAVLAREPLMAGLAAESAPGCPQILLIGARGSGEPDERSTHGLGPEVNALFEALSEGLSGVTVPKRLLVVYPAAGTDVLFPSKAEVALAAAALLAGPVAIAAFVATYKERHVDPFAASVDEGVTAALDELTTEAVQCPHARFVLAGYSQGAMVFHQVLLRLADRNRLDILDRIVATALIADGDRKRETAATRSGTAPFDGEGVRSAVVTGERDIPSSKATTTYDVCNEGDIVCDFTLSRLGRFQAGVDVHTQSYGTLIRNLGKRIAGQIAAETAPAPQKPPAAHDCAAFVSDVTIPDGTPVAAGSSLTKVWRLRNCGTTDWSGLTATRTSGTFGPATFAVARTAPNTVVDVAATMSAPDGPGSYKAVYRLRATDGHFADNSFWVQITVAAAGPAPVTSRPPAPPVVSSAPEPAEKAPPPMDGPKPPTSDPGQIPLPDGARRLGGVDLQRYCHDGWDLYAVLRFPVTWGWRCSTSPVAASGLRQGDQDISVDDACAQQYSAEARSHYDRYDDPHSWFCFVP